MWTPRRILLLCLGWTLILGFYLGYGFVLGSIDGLPPLPKGLMPHSREHLPPLPARPASRVVSKLQLAFGPDCPEVGRQIKIEIGSKKMVFAADQFQPEPDGRVSLKPMSVAIFSSDKSNPRLTEISTIRGQVAYIKFDRPVAQLSDIGNRKIVAAEISGSIEVTNNRRTQGRDDDLSVFIPTGPLHYADARKLIWTTDSVHLLDNQSKPKPIDVRGRGLEIELASEMNQPPQPGQPKKPKGDAVAGVKRVKLVEAVDMHLHVREDSGFLGQSQNQQKPTAASATAKPAPEQQAYIRIKTPGSFEYFFRSEKEGNLAVFSLPEPQPGGPTTPADIFVTRHHEGRGATDQLMCERLELILRRKESSKGTVAAMPPVTTNSTSPAGTPPDSSSQPAPVVSANPLPLRTGGGGTEIDSAHATGKEVILLSDAERLEAHGDDLLFEAKLHRTTLSGKDGMSAMLDGGILKAKRLEIDQHKPGESSGRGLKRLVAQGPGQILLKEKDPARKPSKASWRDTLISERDGSSERMTLNGQATFTDEQNDQILNADTLKVWLPARNGLGANQTPEPKNNPGNLPGALGVSSMPSKKTNKPERVEALGKVYLRSKDIVVHDSHRLMVWFKDVVTSAPTAPQKVLPAMPAPGAPVVVNAPNNPAGQPPASPANTATGGFGLGLTNNKDPKAQARPLDLTARSIEAWIFRMDNRDRLDRLRCEGTVQVRQEPAKPEDKGLDIRGETLQLTGSPDGNLLTVTGDLAQLRMDRKLIVGPEVNIDEAANKVWVTGIGAIQMESLTNFQGDKLSKPVPMEVHWNKSMLLNGQYAEFHGGIQAEQEQARLACQGLQVYFDNPISLRNGGKGAHVQNLVCDQRVRVEDSTKENGKLLRYQRIVAVTLSMNQVDKEDDSSPIPPTAAAANAKKNSEIRASGPGEVRVLQLGGAEPAIMAGTNPGAVPPPEANAKTTSAAKPPAKSGDKQQMKMTFVSFQKSMFGSNNRQNKASFLENVRVLNFPCDDPNTEIDIDRILDRMPPEALYLRCDKLDVLSHNENGVTHQEMRARGRVVAQSREFSGTGELVTYDEAKGQVIFHGSSMEPAVLYRQLKPGAKPDEVKARKITYNRTSGQIRIDEGSSLGGS